MFRLYGYIQVILAYRHQPAWQCRRNMHLFMWHPGKSDEFSLLTSVRCTTTPNMVKHIKIGQQVAPPRRGGLSMECDNCFFSNFFSQWRAPPWTCCDLDLEYVYNIKNRIVTRIQDVGCRYLRFIKTGGTILSNVRPTRFGVKIRMSENAEKSQNHDRLN